MEKTKNSTKSGVEIGKSTITRLDESIKKSIKKTQSYPLVSKSSDITSNTARNISISNKQEIKKNGQKVISQIKEKSLNVFEEFVGTIRKGTQYGKTSIAMLAELAKMKELGIITDEEFELKKKQILGRI